MKHFNLLFDYLRFPVLFLMQFFSLQHTKKLMGVLLFATLPLHIHAAEYSCLGETITELEGATSDISVSESNEQTSSNITQYLKFQTGVDGELRVRLDRHNYTQRFKISDDQCNGNSVFNTKSSDDEDFTINISKDKIYYIKLKEKNNDDKLYFDLRLDFTADTTQTPPTMDPIPDQTAIVGSNYSLDISQYAHETDGDPITQYNLTCLPDGLSFDQNSGLLSGTPTTAGTHNCSATAEDNDGLSNNSDFTLTISTDNAGSAPIADAGPDQNVLQDENVTVDGSGSSDDTGIVSYVWSVNGNSFSGVTATIPASVLQIGDNTVTLTVTDDAGLSDSDTMVIHVMEVVYNADDLCYEDQFTGCDITVPIFEECPCNDIGPCEGELTCIKGFPIKNKGDSDLTDISIIYNEDGMMQGSFGSGCGVDDDPSDGRNGTGGGTCETVHGIDFGPFGFFGSATKYDINGNIVPDNNDTSIWAKNFMEGSCFTGESLYGEYIKDGKLHRGKMKPCSPGNGINNGYRDFTLRYQNTFRGNLITVGNTILVAPDESESNNILNGQANCNTYRKGPYIDDADHANNRYNLCAYYADDNVNFPTTKANIPLPDSSLVKVKWAGLYWQSIVPDNTDVASMQIKIRHENFNQYTSIGFDTLDWINNDGYNGYTSYSAFKDITSYFRDNHLKAGDFYVGDIPVYEGNIPSLGTYGAWTLVVVYEDPDDKQRLYSIYDGWKIVDSSTPEVEVTISDFVAPKEVPVSSEASVFTAEGDKHIENDYLKVKPSLLNSWTTLSHTVNQTFNSAIETPTEFTRTPNPLNNQGIDIQAFTLGTDGLNVIRPNESEVKFKFGSDQDRYWPSMIAFNTELRLPDLCYDYTYGQDGYYRTAPNTNEPYIDDSFDVSKPLDIKLYVKNRENSDIILTNTYMHIRDINTTQAVYQRDSTYMVPPGGTITHVPDDGREVSDSKNLFITTGDLTVNGLEYFYTYYSLDLQKEDIKMPINAYIQYNMNVHGIDIGTQEMALKDMPICQDNGSYLPTYGAFNVVHASQTKGDDPYFYYNLPTQVVKRAGHYLLESMTGDQFNQSETATETSVKAAAVEMINADGFHYVEATCTDPKTLTVSDQKIWTVIREGQYANDINQSELLNKGFFKQAVSNAAFRISYNKSSDDSMILFEKLGDDSYKLINYPDYGGGQCSDTFIPPRGNSRQISSWCGSNTGGNTGNGGGGASGLSVRNGELQTCMECLYGYNTRKLCSRDNFSIRPEAFQVALIDANATQRNDIATNTPAPNPTNLAGGYSYLMEVNATDHLNSTPVSRYHAEDVNASLAWIPTSDDSKCNDTENKEHNISFSNGFSDSAITINQVGKYTLNILDPLWTRVDHDTTYMTHHVLPYFSSAMDCTVDSSRVSPSSSYAQNGCNISSAHTNIEPDYEKHFTDMNLTFYPYQFDVSGIVPKIGSYLRSNGQTFVYMDTPSTLENDNKNMSYNLNGTFFASGKNGQHLTNFVKGCYADDLKMDLNFTYNSPVPTTAPYLNYSLRDLDTVTNTTLKPSSGIGLYVPGEPTQSTSPVISVTQEKEYFAKDMEGAITMDLGFNFKRDYNNPVNPRYIEFHDLNISYITNPSNIYADLSNSYVISKDLSLDQNVTFIYGRAKSSRFFYDDILTSSVKTPVSVVAYCDQGPVNCSALYNINSVDFNQTNEYNWYLVTNHYMSDDDGNISLAVGVPANATINHNPNIEGTGGFDDTVEVTASVTTRPLDVDINFFAPGTNVWLIYNKDSATLVPSPFYHIRFINTGGWTGTGKTGHVVGDDINSKKTRRLEW